MLQFSIYIYVHYMHFHTVLYTLYHIDVDFFFIFIFILDSSCQLLLPLILYRYYTDMNSLPVCSTMSCITIKKKNNIEFTILEIAHFIPLIELFTYLLLFSVFFFFFVVVVFILIRFVIVLFCCFSIIFFSSK